MHIPWEQGLIAYALSFCQVIKVGMFELHCDELIRGLTKRADNLRSKLLQRMIKDHQILNKREDEENF